MCKEEQHLITSIMLGDLVPHGGHQLVYGWYLRHAIRAGILLRLMGWTEGLDCQHGASTHFSYQVSEVPPSATPSTPNLPVLPSSVNGDWVSWNTEAWKRVSISISFSWQIAFFSTQRPWTTSSQFLFVTSLAAEDLVKKWGKCMCSASIEPAGAWQGLFLWKDVYRIYDYSSKTENGIVHFT